MAAKTDKKNEQVIFLAAFPPIQTAIKVDGSGGMRIQLDIPESEMAEAVKLMLYRQVVLKVTIEAQPKRGRAKGDDIDQILDELDDDTT